MKLADLENPQFRTRIWNVFYTGGRVIADVVFKNPNFCYHSNRGPLKTSCDNTIKLVDAKTILWYRNLGIYSYGNRIIANTAVRGLNMVFIGKAVLPYC